MPATPKQMMQTRAAGEPLSSLVIPKFPPLNIPPKIAVAFPDFAEALRQHNTATERWREQVNGIFTGKAQQPT